ncbi:RHTO0S02e14004g1_1 [Rhodotorula toruloides]|uniref:RHTO0S02e14004g1_1 n=2 Tax=Rhodotorula toruloides TaxID=5286 RepID=A0A061ARM5_RHOTO|nr:serine/threonine protein kinase [Rhodotorula toruloides NP11]EMS23425.1 serine/threonine protein kinase [Rhodotorula toruloides NP11]CDR37370.1 RHTO0S02e14004g1_1 [Rhodotorula toruloides]
MTRFYLAHDAPPACAPTSVTPGIQHLVDKQEQPTCRDRSSHSSSSADLAPAKAAEPLTPPLLPCSGGVSPCSHSRILGAVCAESLTVTEQVTTLSISPDLDGGDVVDDEPARSAHENPEQTPSLAPKDAVQHAHGLLIDDYQFSRRGTSGASSFLEVILEDELGAGAGGDVYTDPSGMLAIKVIVPQGDESFEQYEDRWDEGVREVEALERLKGCLAPELYGVFERTDDEGYRWVVIVSERIRGKACGDSEFKKYRLDIAHALIRLHTCGILHGDVRPQTS